MSKGNRVVSTAPADAFRLWIQGGTIVAGQVLVLINKLVDARAKGNAVIASTTRTKLLMKGIKAENWTASSPDDPAMLSKVREAAREMGVAI